VSPKPGAKGTVRLDPDELAGLEEQRDFLLSSIADLDREHAARDLDDADHAALRDDYTARAAEVLRAIDEQRSAFADARRPRSLGRTLGLSAAVVVFAILAGIVAANAMGARKAGESASGGVSVQASPSQRANECSTTMGTDPEGSFTCLEGVLDDDPENAVALTWSAWILSLSANSFEETEKVIAQAEAALRLERAVEADPDYSFARAFRAVVAYRNGRFAEAQQYLEEFEANDPSAQAQQIIEQQGLAADIEAALAEQSSGSTTTTAPTSSTTTTAPPG
jgi:tetratricopeptide (TPR) repeat protein